MPKSARFFRRLARHEGGPAIRRRANQVLFGMMTLLGIVTVGAEISNTLEYAFVKDIWHAGSLFGYLMSAFGVGMIAAGLLVSGPLRGRRAETPAGVGVRNLHGGRLRLGIRSELHKWALLALVVFGLGNMLINIPLMTLFQTVTAQNMIGRVIATAGVVNRIAMLVAGRAGRAPHAFPLAPIFFGPGRRLSRMHLARPPPFGTRAERDFPGRGSSRSLVSADVKPARS